MEFRRANKVYEDVLGNLVDLGFVAYPEKSRHLEVVPLWSDKLVLICHPQNPLAKRKIDQTGRHRGQKFIAFEADIPTRKAIDKILRGHNVAVKIAMEFDNIETVKRAVEIDAGISIVPERTVVQESGEENAGGR